MKVNAIKLNNYAQFFRANNKPAEENNNKNKNTGTKLAYGVAGLTAIGIATYAILKGRKPSEKVINETVSGAEDTIKGTAGNAEDLIHSAAETIKPKNTAGITKTENKPFSRLGIGETEPFDGIEKLISVDFNDGTGRTYQRFYHKDKVYEYNVFEEILGETPSTKNITRYNFAYENGRLIGAAKQDVYKEGLQHGEYLNNDFNPFPIMIKMKGDKEFRESKVFTTDALFDLDKRFNPENL